MLIIFAFLAMVNVFFCHEEDIFELTAFRPCKFSVRCVGKLGNQIISVLYALHGAIIMQADLEIWGERCYAGLVQTHKNNFLGLGSDRLRWNDWLIGEQNDHSNQCYGNERSYAFLNHPILSPTVYQVNELIPFLHSALNLYGDFVGDVALNKLVSLNSTITVYMRSGDIFMKNFHPSYIQAPCAYFDAALEFAAFARIVVVTSTTSEKLGANPCISYLRKTHANVTIFTGSVKDSYIGLLHARHLVLSGVSSFGSTASLLSKHLRTLHLPMFFPASTTVEPTHKLSLAEQTLSYRKADCRWAWPRVLNGTYVHRYRVSNYPPTPMWSAHVPLLMHEKFDVQHINLWPKEFFNPWSSQLTILASFLTLTEEEFSMALGHDLAAFVDHFKFLVQKRYLSASLLPSPVLVLTCQSSENVRRWFHRYFVPELPLYLVSFLTIRDSKLCCKNSSSINDIHAGFISSQGSLLPRLEDRVLRYVHRNNFYSTTHAAMHHARLDRGVTGAQLIVEIMHRILYEPIVSFSPKNTYHRIYTTSQYSLFRLRAT